MMVLSEDRSEDRSEAFDDEDDDDDDLDFVQLKKDRARCIIELKTFIFVIQETLVEVYSLQELVKTRVNAEQLENFVASLLLSGPIYILIYNLISLSE